MPEFVEQVWSKTYDRSMMGRRMEEEEEEEGNIKRGRERGKNGEVNRSPEKSLCRSMRCLLLVWHLRREHVDWRLLCTFLAVNSCGIREMDLILAFLFAMHVIAHILATRNYSLVFTVNPSKITVEPRIVNLYGKSNFSICISMQFIFS